MEIFSEGKVFNTPLGDLKVLKFDKQWDEDANIFRFAKISFSLDEEFIGSFVSRASSNDPTAVQTFEVKGFSKNHWNIPLDNDTINNRLALIGGLVLTEGEKLGLFVVNNVEGSKNMELIMPIVNEYKKMIARGI
jgi:hypothetical protein